MHKTIMYNSVPLCLCVNILEELLLDAAVAGNDSPDIATSKGIVNACQDAKFETLLLPWRKAETRQNFDAVAL